MVKTKTLNFFFLIFRSASHVDSIEEIKKKFCHIHFKDLAQWPLVLQSLQIESFAGHNAFRKTWNLIQNLHFLGLSFGMSQGGKLLLSEVLCNLLFL